MKKIILTFLVFCSSYLLLFHSDARAQTLNFNYQNVNDKGTQGHALGDMDGDGDMDIILAEGEFAENEIFAWLAYPDWSIHAIDNSFIPILDYVPELQVNDLDADGDMDVIVPNSDNSGPKTLTWFENLGAGQSFTKRQIWSQNDEHMKDLAISDLDRDGKLDIAIRYEAKMRIFFQVSKTSWTVYTQAIGEHEGMDLGDLDGDTYPDMVLNGYWLKNPRNRTGSWARSDIDARWFNEGAGWPNSSARVEVADINGDGRLDPIFSDSEQTNAIIWYQATNASATTWQSHIIVSSFDRAHSLQAADFDRDGDLDILAAGLPGNNKIIIYLNSNSGNLWSAYTLANNSSYIAKVGDIDKNGSPDVLGSRSFDSGPIEVWFNQIAPTTLPLNRWTYSAIDNNSTKGQAFGLTFADLNRDGFMDVLTGNVYYKNPGGNMQGSWSRSAVAEGTDFKLTLDVDADQFPDVIGNGSDNFVRWYEADSAGQLVKRKDAATMAPSQHSSGQGYTAADIIAGGKSEFALNGGPISGNGDQHSIFYFTIPPDPLNTSWTKTLVAVNATGDGLAAADFDKDGDIDLLSALGTDGKTIAWWENASWTQRTVGTLNSAWADVTAAADFDKDSDQDIVVAKEGDPGEVYYFRNNGGGSWTRSIIFTGSNTASLDIGDLDRDGDVDIVVGEHKGEKRVVILANNGNGGGWTQTVVGSAPNGGDNHLGTRLSDLDRDGDLDIVSIGYDYPLYVHLWRNDAIAVNQPTPSITPTPKPGDANGDGKVDVADYTIWLVHFGQNTNNGYRDGDFNGSGKVDGIDYVIWLNNYGK